MKKLLVLVLALALVTGCVKNTVTNPTPRVVYVNTLLSAAEADDTLSLALRSANDAVIKLRATEPDYYNTVHPYLVRLAVLNDKAIAVLRLAQSGDTSANWRGALLAIADEAAKTDPLTFGFKNPNTRATVAIIFASFRAAIQVINQSLRVSALLTPDETHTQLALIRWNLQHAQNVRNIEGAN